MKSISSIFPALLMTLLLSSCIVLTEEENNPQNDSGDSKNINTSVYDTLLAIENISESTIKFQINGERITVNMNDTVYLTDSTLSYATYSYSTEYTVPNIQYIVVETGQMSGKISLSEDTPHTTIEYSSSVKKSMHSTSAGTYTIQASAK